MGITVGYPQTNRKTDTGKTLTRWPVFVDHFSIIMAFSTYGYSSETIKLPFTEFAKMCGIKSADLNARSRKRLHDSLFSISSVTLAFSSKDGKKSMFSHLVQRAVLNMNTDTVVNRHG